MSGVSLLASRLKMDPWMSQETVKLSDSISSANIPEQELDIKAQIEFLISQTNAQERALLRYHAELTRRVEEVDNLKCLILSKNQLKIKYKYFIQWRGLMTSKQATEGNGTDTTLRNLALSLNSPLRPQYHDLNSSTSTIKSVTAMPFQTVRLRPTSNTSFSLNASLRRMM